MLTRRHYLKHLRMTTVLISVIALAGVTTVACGNKTPTPTPPVANTVYNQWATDLSQSNDPFDAQTLSWYQQNTASLFVGKAGANSGSQGTIWNYPAPDGDAFNHYFATNIHVVADALVPSTNHTYTLDLQYVFYASSNGQTNMQLRNVALAYLATQGRPSGLIGGQWTGDWYNDFVVLRSSTPIFLETNTLNFMDDETEYNWFIDNYSNANLYSCGWPALNDAGWPYSSEWVNIKYHWDAALKQSIFEPSLNTAADFSNGYLNFTNTDGLKIGAEGNQRLAKSYALQTMLPELNTQGGSSGSLVSVDYNNSLMLVGIYWGGYAFGTNSNEAFLGGGQPFLYCW